MVQNERKQFGEWISKYRRVKRGLAKFWKIYKIWIAKVKLQRQEEIKEAKLQENQPEIQKVEKEEEEKEESLEELQLELQRIEETKKKLEEAKLKKATPDEIWEIQEVNKWEFVLNEYDDIFSLNEGVDLSKFQDSGSANFDEYSDKIKGIKEDKKKIKNEIKNKKLDEIVEEDEESIILSPFHMKAGKVLASKIEAAWEKKMQRKEGKKIRELLKNLPPQCRNSYVKLMQLRNDTANLQQDVGTMPVRFF